MKKQINITVMFKDKLKLLKVKELKYKISNLVKSKYFRNSIDL
jgi:hypothetical protein